MLLLLVAAAAVVVVAAVVVCCRHCSLGPLSVAAAIADVDSVAVPEAQLLLLIRL